MSYSNQTSQQPQKSGCGCGGIITIVLVIATIYSAVRYFIDKSNYTKAHQAYIQANCEVAIKSFDNIINAWRLFDFGEYTVLAQKEHTECQAFQTAADKQTSGDPSGAILSYNDFIFNYGSSPLVEEASSRIKSAFTQTNIDVLANEALCDQVEILEQANLIPQKSTLLPNLLYECGQTYEGIKYYSGAIQMYDKFLSEYPSHSLASSVEDSLARAIVADARASGAGIIPAPERSGSTSGGSTLVIIQNDSPERLRIVFSGPDSRIEELAACSSCQTYSLIGPLYCPEQGPIGRYTLPPGQYDVVVQSISDNGVTPWTGDWDLISGDEYYSCFFITVTSLP